MCCVQNTVVLLRCKYTFRAPETQSSQKSIGHYQSMHQLQSGHDLPGKTLSGNRGLTVLIVGFAHSFLTHYISLQVTVIADSVGGLLAYDILTHDEEVSEMTLNFAVDKFFSFGSPIGNLALYKALSGKPVHPKKIHTQFYNLFYASSPGAIRIEPILDAHLSAFPPVCIPRFNKVPFGAGSKYLLNSLLEEHRDYMNSPVHAIHPTEVASTAGQARPISTSSLGINILDPRIFEIG
eukprot:sb/3469211/